jgi:AcrR family transcriptional regulator
MPASARSTYHHGALRPALIAAARALLDEGGPQAVGLRETARRVGVSPTATYRHFRDKDSLLAAVAAEGFRAFGAALAGATGDGQPFSAMGRAYVEFALANPGLFRLMFGAQIRERARFPELTEAADAAFTRLKAATTTEGSAVAAWSLVHGLSHLLLDGMLPRESASALMDAILAPPAA